MSSIRELLNDISCAIFGREVRKAIHDAIEECYNTASIEHDNANMEVKLARGIYNTLNERLDDSENDIKINKRKLIDVINELAEKLNKGEPISAGQIVGGLTENQISDSFRDIISGNAPLSAVVKEKSIDNKKLTRNTVGVPEADFLTCGKNLYDKTRREINKVIQGSIPSTYNVADNSSYDVTDFIYVQMGKNYTCNVGARNIYLLNIAGECIEVITTRLNTNTPKFTFTASQTGYIRASLYKQYVETWQFEESDIPTRFEEYRRVLSDDLQKNIELTKKQVTDFNVESDDCNFLTVAKNLLNPGKFLIDKLITKNNTIVENTSYKGYMIELEPGTYTISGKSRNIFQFDSNLTGTGLINTISNATVDTTITFTIDVKSWIGINFFKEVDKAQLEAGSSPTTYEKYSYSMERLNFTKEQIEILKSEVSETTNNYELKVVKENNKFNIFSKLNDKTIKYETEIEDIRNKCFNFVNTYLVKDNKEILIHNQGDDITPIRTFYTVGANHGYPCFSLPSNGQTSADIGSVWTDGATDYVLAKVENDKCIFLYPYHENEDGIVSYSNVAPVKNLEAKINVTNTNILDISSLAVEQFYPSTNNHTYQVEIVIRI